MDKEIFAVAGRGVKRLSKAPGNYRGFLLTGVKNLIHRNGAVAP